MNIITVMAHYPSIPGIDSYEIARVATCLDFHHATNRIYELWKDFNATRPDSDAQFEDYICNTPDFTQYFELPEMQVYVGHDRA